MIPIVASILDRVRGSGAPPLLRSVGTVVVGALLVALLTGTAGWGALAGGVLWWLGEKPGWGSPLAAVLYGRPQDGVERWQVGFLRRAPVLSLVLRGVMWGLPVMVLYPWFPAVAYLPGLMGMALPLSAGIARIATLYSERAAAFGPWPLSEFIRGFIIAVACAAVGVSQ